jgi:hypothetical protein
MKKFSYLAVISIILLVMVGCSSSQPQTKDAMDIRIERCPWTMNEPEVEGSDLYFVGLSLVYATEQDSRNDAMRNANRRIIEYLGSEVKSKFEEAKVSYGLSSDAIDPVRASREFQRLFAENNTSQVKATKWCPETEETATGKGYKNFVLVKVPKTALEQTFQETLKREKQKAEGLAKGDRQEATEGQAEKAAKMWADLEKQGLIE